MQLLRKVRLLLSLDMKAVWLLAEAYVYLGWARWLIALPFARVAPLLGESMQETPRDSRPEDIAVIRRVSEAILLMSNYTIWESKCLVRAIAGMKMLERRKIGSTLYLGTSRDEKTGALSAHAWLRSGPYVLTGADVMDQYTVVAVFAKKMCRESGRNA